MEWLEKRLDKIEAKVDSIENSVAKLEERVGTRNRLLLALTGLLGAIASALLSSGCVPAASAVKRAVPEYADDTVRHEYLSTVSLTVDCVYPAWEPKDDQEAFMVLFLGGPPKRVGGSGAAVSPSGVVTARHVVSCDWESPSGTVLDGEPWNITGKSRDGQSFELVVTDMGVGPPEEFPRRDVAVLQTVAARAPFKRWARLSNSIPRIGSEVCVVAARPYWGRLCGHVQDYLHDGDVFENTNPRDPEWGGDGYFTYDVFTTGGTSGGGVWDEHGELVGVNVGNTANMKLGYLAAEWRHLIPKVWADLEF